MHTNTTKLFLALALAASTLNCAGADDGFAVDSEPSSVSSLGVSSGTVIALPDSKLVGSWVGTWKINGSATDYGSISISVSESGAMTGNMEYSGTEEQKSFGAGTLTGQVNGSAAIFSYDFVNLAQVSGTGSFGEVSDTQTKITFSVNGSSGSTGYFDLIAIEHLKARIR